MEYLFAFLLGLIQGLTEFLPVSSSGHIELGKAILGYQMEEDLLFSVVLHVATALSTLIVFRTYIIDLLKDIFKFQWNEATQFAVKIIISMIPVGIVGVFFKDDIEQLFEGRVMFVGFMLLITGCLLLLTNFLEKRMKEQHVSGEVDYLRAFLIGISQAIAVTPGISRSGATIASGLLLGVEREKAARFSFLMVIPPILGACLLEIKDFVETPAMSGSINFGAMGIGFITAFLVGLIACRWMVELVKKGKLIYFAVYCLVVGSLSILLILSK
ncbi:MAG: undecaprenyl-diphosphate phosphatase [Flammeovirgaceae bacterium]